jgi:hypothetical protein
MIVKHPATRRGFPELNYFFRYMPLDPAYKAGLARHETGHNHNYTPRAGISSKILIYDLKLVIPILKVNRTLGICGNETGGQFVNVSEWPQCYAILVSCCY